MKEVAFGLPVNTRKPMLMGFDRRFVDDYFDVLNLQSDRVDNFELDASGGIIKWCDRSPNKNHGTPTSVGARPAYNAGQPLWSAGKDLQLAEELNLPNFSMYIVFRNSNPLAQSSLWGGVSRNDFTLFTAQRGYSIAHIGVGTTQVRMGGEEYYQVFSIRKSASTGFSFKINDRTLYKDLGGTIVSPDGLRIGYIGRTQGGFSLAGNILAFCVNGSYVDDATDQFIREALYTRYSIPTTSPTIMCFGNSTTEGTGITYVQTWPYKLSITTGLPNCNLGITSTALVNTGLAVNNGKDRFKSQMLTRTYNDWLLILYDTNDVNSGFSAALWGSILEECIQIALATGYSPRKIVLGTCVYQAADANAALLTAYKDKVIELATTYNTRYADTLTAMRTGGGDTLLVDGIHPNDAGTTVIADTFNTAMQGA